MRHAEPVATADMAAAQWPLTAAGRESARQLSRRLPSSGIWIASTEVKALETLVCARPNTSIEVLQDARFDEVHRNEPFDADFAERRRLWVAGRLDSRHDGWERPEEAVARFDAAIADYLVHDRRVVICSHAMVLTAWLVHIGVVAAGQAAGDFWAALSFPELIEINRPETPL